MYVSVLFDDLYYIDKRYGPETTTIPRADRWAVSHRLKKGLQVRWGLPFLNAYLRVAASSWFFSETWSISSPLWFGKRKNRVSYAWGDQPATNSIPLTDDHDSWALLSSFRFLPCKHKKNMKNAVADSPNWSRPGGHGNGVLVVSQSCRKDSWQRIMCYGLAIAYLSIPMGRQTWLVSVRFRQYRDVFEPSNKRDSMTT